MFVPRWVLAFVGGVVFASLVSWSVPAARAEAPRTVECRGNGMVPNASQEWIGAQLAQGRTNFVPVGGVICAW